MSKLKELVQSPHIQIALATGFSIIVLAWFSKRILAEPIDYLHITIPPFIATIYETILAKYKNSRICTTWYWIAAILFATALVIVISWKEVI